ncbi:hypothetical protein QAD02_015689 [Eretmocerus hayati]|uniref:Uncharacterized protein n=1 Tax=Eretmocerus hayati TaxID=131215 RepID=A0ACC2PBT0_9HYME|nr:hypothetical protein QAD02_015689 [Eretmocerus hayati]
MPETTPRDPIATLHDPTLTLPDLTLTLRGRRLEFRTTPKLKGCVPGSSRIQLNQKNLRRNAIPSRHYPIPPQCYVGADYSSGRPQNFRNVCQAPPEYSEIKNICDAT